MEFAQSAPAALQLIGDMANASLILIFSDINMPGMTGLELLPKAKSVRPDVPVIMITESADETVLRPSDSSSTTRMRRFTLALLVRPTAMQRPSGQALEGGAEALFTKPIDFGMLRGEIDTRVERAT